MYVHLYILAHCARWAIVLSICKILDDPREISETKRKHEGLLRIFSHVLICGLCLDERWLREESGLATLDFLSGTNWWMFAMCNMRVGTIRSSPIFEWKQWDDQGTSLTSANISYLLYLGNSTRSLRQIIYNLVQHSLVHLTHRWTN